jgi:hypothetical protein
MMQNVIDIKCGCCGAPGLSAFYYPDGIRDGQRMMCCVCSHWMVIPAGMAEFSRAERHRQALVSNLAVRQYANRRSDPEIVPLKKSYGSLKGASQAFVYVGSRHSRIKIGMSANPQRRCKNLGCILEFAVPVVVSAAKLVETFALRELGATIEDDEWVDCDVSAAISAVNAAWLTAANVTHTDPNLTAEEARLDRIRRLSPAA